jgi:hypothetical protein
MFIVKLLTNKIMKHYFRAWSVIILAIASFLISCEESTESLGIYPQQNAIQTSSASFDILSSSVANNNVPANSTTCFLGKVIDPETDKAITATFAAQFHTFENYVFPDEAHIVKSNGHLCESVDIRLIIRSTFGDKNNPMKVEVWPLSKDNDKLLKESEKLYTNTDLWQYVDDSEGKPVATKVFTATDYIVSEDQRASDNYTPHVRIVLPQEVGDKIMRAYYDNPDPEKSPFRDSYSFIRNVCSGFLFQTVGGTGTMLNLEVCTMDLFFSYKSEEFPDSTLAAYCRFAATPEVIQSTQFESSNLAGLIGNEEYTMLKTPAGICTELILPVNEICKGHENDSITRASFTLTRINNQDEDALDDDYALGIPQNLLLVRKQNLSSFFENHQVADNQQSYSTFYYETFNCYRFDNISHLISYCWLEKKSGIQASGMTEEAWEAAHPEWNHVVLVPVSIATASNTFGEGLQVSVNHDLSLCSTKLVRGTEAKPIQMQVIYSRFAGN